MHYIYTRKEHRQDTWKIPKNQAIKEISEVAEYKINIQIAFIYTNIKQRK